MRKLSWTLIAVAAVSIGLVGCGDDDDEKAAGTVEVTLSDFKIELGDTSAPSGDVTFAVHNAGPSVHELVVFKTDLAPDALPTDENGDIAESPTFAPVDEVEDIANDANPKLTIKLAAGNYVLACNIAGHYRQGMRTAFTVS